jgi:hypothetical protein
MTRKDYEAFAKMYREYGVYTCPDTLTLAKRTAGIFERDNQRFDRTRFLAACGVKKEDM